MSGRFVTGFKAFFVTLFIVGWIGLLFAMVIANETPTGVVQGVVVHRDKEVYKGRVADARITLSGGDVLKQATTDARGEYRFTDVPTGEYYIQAEATGLVAYDLPSVEVKEGKTSKADPIVMRTRPPELYISLHRSVFTPGERIRLNIRGYAKTSDTVHLTIHKLDARAYYLVRDNEPWGHADHTPIKEWDEPLKRNPEGFFARQVTIPADKEQGYVVRATLGKRVSDEWFMVTRLGVVTKVSKDKFVAYCTDLVESKPVEGVAVTVYDLGIKQTTGTTGSDGLLVISPSPGSDLAIVAEKGGSLALDRNQYYGRTRGLSFFMYTDRPVYRPGHQVFFKGILRERQENFYTVPADVPVRVEIKEPNGRLIKTLNLKTNSDGSFSGDITLGDEAPLGSYSISAEANGDSSGTRFEVAEYRKPEYQASISFDRKYFIAGTRIKGTVQASYYFGAPVSDAEVSYTVYRSPAFYYYGFEGEGEFYSDLEAEYSGQDYGYGELVLEGKGRTDAKGQFRLDIPTDRTQPDSQYQVEVAITDQSLRTVDASGSVFVPKGLFRLDVSTKEYLSRPGEPVEIAIKAVDYEKRPRGNVKVSITVDQEKWQVTTRRYRHVTSGSVTTRADGTAVYRFTPDRQGYFRVRAEAIDRLENVIQGETWVWVASDEFDLEGYKGPELEIVKDKKVYRVGETARVMITSSVKDAYALLTIEGRKLFTQKVIRIENNNAIVELEARREYVPNAFISVALVDGKDLVRQDSPFPVSPAFKFLNVSISSNKEAYKPGEMATYTVKTTDESGQPVPAEVSLGIVDESIYAIMEDHTPEIRNFYYAPEYNRVNTSFSFPDYYQGGADKEGFSGRVRRRFLDTAFWSPDIMTDRNGKASITVKMPDTLTTWRATARAVTLDTSVGQAIYKVRTTKDLIVRLQTPRFFTQKDELSIGAALHNYTDRRQKVRLWLKVEGLDLEGETRRTVTIKPDEAMRFEWPVRASKAGSALLTVYAQSDTDSDAMELEVPILPHGLQRIRTANGSVEKEEQVRIEVPNTAIPETVRLELHITPTAAGTMLGSLAYLADYPYGCVEQTMSKFLPTVIVADTLKTLGRRDPSLENELPKMVQDGLQRLYNFQNDDGGWGWWEDESSPYTTAYVIYGMTYARHAGYQVDESSFQRGMNSLKSQLARVYEALQIVTPDKPPFADPGERIYMLYALSLNGQADVKHVGDIFNGRKKLDNYDRAILALTLYEMGDRQRADQVAGELERASVVFKGLRHWDMPENTWGWDDSSIEATAYGLRALLRLDPKSPKLEEIVRWLTMKRSGDHWDSTKDTAAIIYALAEYVKTGIGDQIPNYTADVYLNGRQQTSLRVTGESIYKSEIVIPLKGAKTGRNTVVIRKTGTGKLYYSTVLRFFSLEENIKAYSSGIRIKREYFRLAPGKDANGVTRLKPVPLGSTQNIPEQILCRLTIRSNDNYHYVVIEDPRPAGWEAMEQLSDGGGYGGWSEDGWAPWTRWEYRDEKVVIFATEIPKGKYVAEYRLRAEIPGTFHDLPTTAYGMYAPVINGNSSEKIVRVR